MRFILNAIGVLAAFFAQQLAVTVSPVRADDRPDIIRLKPGDPEMNAAVREAHAALEAFLTFAANPPPTTSHFSLKVGLPINDVDIEFVWVRPFKRDGADFVGRLVNTPRDYPGLSYGQPIGFARENIIDFAYREGDKLKGHYTTCVLLKRMSDAERAAVLASNPISCVR